MKKFISLVLALVMALSLTTVAWAAGTTAVEITVKDSTELIAAINGDKTKIGLEDGDYALQFTNNTAFNVDGLTIVGLGNNVNLAISSSEVYYGRIQGNDVVFENINFTTNTVGATGKATYNKCTFVGRLECASSGAAETCAYDCVIGEVHTSGDFDAGAAYFENCKIAVADYNAKATMIFTGGSIGELNISGGDTVLDGVEIAPEKISYVGSGNDTIVMDDSLVASDEATLIAAMKAVTSGATIVLLDDITITQDWDCRNTGAKFTVPVTIDGNGKTLKFTGKINDGYNHFCAFRFEADATVKNLTIDMSEAHAVFQNRFRAISAMANLTVDKCNFIGNPVYTNTRAIIFGESAGADISDVKVSVTNSTFKDWTYGLTDNENGKDVESVTVTGNKFTDSSVQLSASETVAFNNNTVDDGKVTITSYAATNELAVTATGNTLGANTTVTVSKAATVTTDSNAFVAPGATLVAPDGYSVVNGKIVAKSSLRGNTTTYDIKDLTVIEPDGTKVDITGLTGITKYAATTNTTTVNGKTTTTVVPAWFLLSEGANNFTFVECDKSVATHMFTIKGVGSFYVRAMDVPAAFDATPVALYTAPKTATCDKVGANEDVYVLVDGKYYPTKNVVVESYGLLNGKMVVFDKTQAGTPTPHDWNNVTAASYNSATGKLTAVKCPVCKGTVAVYEKPGSFDGKEYKLVGGNGIASAYYYVVGAVATTPAGTAGATVESAETFDAGIAMYVGMSVMAAAGSAVVLKKKD